MSLTIPWAPIPFQARSRAWVAWERWSTSANRPARCLRSPCSRLAAKSNTLVRPVLFHYIRDRLALESVAEESFGVMEQGVIRPQIGLSLPLSQAADAHARMESRTTAGQIVLVPNRGQSTNVAAPSERGSGPSHPWATGAYFRSCVAGLCGCRFD